MPSTTTFHARDDAPALPAPIDPSRTIEVTLLDWPRQDDLRRWLADRRHPRILVVDDHADPPEALDALEDWVRGPLQPADEAARCRALRQRAAEAHATMPFLDPDGLLRYDGRWVAIPHGQVPLMQLLLDRIDRVVPTEEIVQVYEAAGGSSHPNTVRTAIGRLTHRVRSVDLELVSVRGRGVLLATRPPSDR